MTFAANLSMMFNEVDFLDRFKAAENSGFKAVEFLFPYDWEADELAAKLAENNLKQALFNLPPGDWDAGERGLASLPGRENEFSESVNKAIVYAEKLKPNALHCMAGLRDERVPYEEQMATFISNLKMAGQRCEEAGFQLLIEPINPIDIPGYFLDDFGLALEIIDEVNRENEDCIQLQFDIYHCRKIHGDVPTWLEKCANYTRHLQIAGTPDRHEPDMGDLPLPEIMSLCNELHPDLYIGCEYRPAGKTEDGLGWMTPYTR